MRPAAAGLAVNASGTRLVVANYENDSISIVDVAARTKIAELDLRPGKNDPSKVGAPGGEYPTWVAIRGDATAYVVSQRDDEVVVADISGRAPMVRSRIAVGSHPSRLLLSRDGTRLYVANANSDSISVIDTGSALVIEQIAAIAPPGTFSTTLRGASPNSLALSPDDETLFVTHGGTNSVALLKLGQKACAARAQRRCEGSSRVVGLIPTGWYPSSVTVSDDGRRLYVVNGKSNAGPNPDACRNTSSTSNADWALSRNQQLHLAAGKGRTFEPAHSRRTGACTSHSAGCAEQPLPRRREPFSRRSNDARGA